MIRSSIDIGTNSVLLLIADISTETIQVIQEEQQIPRLGQGVDQTDKLSDEAQHRVLSVLMDYKALLDLNYPGISSVTIVTATSAVRDAENRSEFINSVYQHTGWHVMLLSGPQEAQMTYKGALSVLGCEYQTSANTVLDIGGGSTEIASGRGKDLEKWDSLNMGSVRFTERFLKNNPPTQAQVDEARNEVRSMLKVWSPSKNIKTEKLICVAGTVTSMAGIEMESDTYDAEIINGHRLTPTFIETMINRLKRMKAEDIEAQYPVFLKGRGDVILGGLIILLEFIDYCNFDKFTVSTGGIRHGTLTEKYQQ
ncbi:Ppx/GppA phosphatase family protein [soil metagenome]